MEGSFHRVPTRSPSRGLGAPASERPPPPPPPRAPRLPREGAGGAPWLRGGGDLGASRPRAAQGRLWKAGAWPRGWACWGRGRAGPLRPRGSRPRTRAALASVTPDPTHPDLRVAGARGRGRPGAAPVSLAEEAAGTAGRPRKPPELCSYFCAPSGPCGDTASGRVSAQHRALRGGWASAGRSEARRHRARVSSPARSGRPPRPARPEAVKAGRGAPAQEGKEASLRRRENRLFVLRGLGPKAFRARQMLQTPRKTGVSQQRTGT